MSVRSTQIVPPSKSSLRTPVSIPPIEPPSNRNSDRRLYNMRPWFFQIHVNNGECAFLFPHLLISIFFFRFTPDIGQVNSKDAGDQREASALRDEV